MPGPNSVPNGDTRLMRGHMDEEFVCERHFDKHLDVCYDKVDAERDACTVVPLRTYLAQRNRLRTGKTK